MLLAKSLVAETSAMFMTLMHHPDIEYLVRQVHSQSAPCCAKVMKIKANNFFSSLLLFIVLLIAMNVDEQLENDVTAQECNVAQDNADVHTAC